MAGSSYRIIVRREGEPLVTSDWLKLTTELTTAKPVRLRQQRKLAGVVHDRQGAPVAGARVFLPSRAVKTTTDSNGRFLLEGVLPDRTYLLVQAPGFRIQGWPVVTARQPEERKLVLARPDELPDHRLEPQPAPISLDERRALARAALEPFLKTALEKGDDNAHGEQLSFLSRIDLARAVELLNAHPLPNVDLDAAVRYRIAVELFAEDPVAAESVVAAIPAASNRCYGYIRLADSLPAVERDRKRGLLDKAMVEVKAPLGAEGGAGPRRRLAELASVARAWLDLGDVDQARPLIREGLKLIEALPPGDRIDIVFLPVAARLELDPVFALLRDQNDQRRRFCYIAIAEAIAGERPADAERVFQLVRGFVRDSTSPGARIPSSSGFATRSQSPIPSAAKD